MGIDKDHVVVMMSTYNGEKYIDTQIRSIFEQQDVTTELIIRNDGSEDGSKEIIDNWEKQLEIRYIKGQNLGAAKSFMELINIVDCEEENYYAFSDQDDYWLPEKLSVAVSKLKESSSVPALYYSTTKRVGSELEEISDPFKKTYHTESLKSALVVTEAPGCTMVFNGKLLGVLKKYSPLDIYMHDEWILCVCLAVGGKVIFDSTPHIMYRQHEHNVLSSLGKRTYTPWRLLLYRIRKFFDFRYKPSVVANELNNGYRNEMLPENLKLIELLIGSKTNFLKRLKILIMGSIRTQYRVYNLKFCIQILLNEH